MKLALPRTSLAALALPALLASCATSVYHPLKSDLEMQADVNLCTTAANKKYWMDPVAALLNAYDCLEAQGYSRKNKAFARQVEKSASGTESDNPSSATPCKVPCKSLDQDKPSR